MHGGMMAGMGLWMLVWALLALVLLVEVTAAAARGAGGRTVGLLGAAFTMEQDFCRDRLASHGLTVIVPDAADRAVVHRVGYDELVVGVVSQASRKAYLAVIDRFVPAGAQGIVPGCTRSSCSSGCTTAQCRRSRPPASTSGPPSTEPSPRADQRTSPARRACTRETGGDHAVVRASQASDTGLRGASARNDGGPGRGGAPRGGDPHPHPRTGEATRLVLVLSRVPRRGGRLPQHRHRRRPLDLSAAPGHRRTGGQRHRADPGGRRYRICDLRPAPGAAIIRRSPASRARADSFGCRPAPRA